jgi:hypothetical protein
VPALQAFYQTVTLDETTVSRAVVPPANTSLAKLKKLTDPVIHGALQRVTPRIDSLNDTIERERKAIGRAAALMEEAGREKQEREKILEQALTDIRPLEVYRDRLKAVLAVDPPRQKRPKATSTSARSNSGSDRGSNSGTKRKRAK